MWNFLFTPLNVDLTKNISHKMHISHIKIKYTCLGNTYRFGDIFVTYVLFVANRRL